jgi:hypothetical protein
VVPAVKLGRLAQPLAVEPSTGQPIKLVDAGPSSTSAAHCHEGRSAKGPAVRAAGPFVFQRSFGRAQGQVVPPLEFAPVPSPLPQTKNEPAAVVYLYETPEPVQPPGSAGDAFRKGPPIWFWEFVCAMDKATGMAPLCPVAIGQFVAAEVLSGKPPQCAA